jgi:hypothetical protein
VRIMSTEGKFGPGVQSVLVSPLGIEKLAIPLKDLCLKFWGIVDSVEGSGLVDSVEGSGSFPLSEAL